MTVKNTPSGRLPETAMRDLLRNLERQADANHPARPGTEPPLAALTATTSAVQDYIRIGRWQITEDALSGDLVALGPDGDTHTLIHRQGEP